MKTTTIESDEYSIKIVKPSIEEEFGYKIFVGNDGDFEQRRILKDDAYNKHLNLLSSKTLAASSRASFRSDNLMDSEYVWGFKQYFDDPSNPDFVLEVDTIMSLDKSFEKGLNNLWVIEDIKFIKQVCAA